MRRLRDIPEWKFCQYLLPEPPRSKINPLLPDLCPGDWVESMLLRLDADAWRVVDLATDPALGAKMDHADLERLIGME